MDAHRNPNLETTHRNPNLLPSPEDFKRTHLHHMSTYGSEKVNEDEGLIVKNACEGIKKPSLSCSLVASGGDIATPPSPSFCSQEFKRTHMNFHGSKKIDEDEGCIVKNAYEAIKKPSFSCSPLAAGEGEDMTTPPPPSSSSSSQDFKKSHHHHMNHVSKKINEDEGFIIKKPSACSLQAVGEGDVTTPPPPPQEMVVEESGRERLKRHRLEMAGRVWIPDIWGHEDVLKDWIDCTVFDSSLGNNTIMSARAALVQEGRSTLRIENRC